MTNKEIIKVISTELECVESDCDRDCANCELVMDSSEIAEAYREVLKIISMIESE